MEDETESELRELRRSGSVSGASAGLRAALESIFSRSSQPAEPPPPPPPRPPPPPPIFPGARPPPQVTLPEPPQQQPAPLHDRAEGPRNRRPRSNSRRGGGGGGQGAAPAAQQMQWISMAGVVLLALMVAFLLGRTPTAAPPPVEPSADVNSLFRTQHDTLASALKEATTRADQAIAERERFSASRDACRRDLIAAERNTHALVERERTLAKLEAKLEQCQRDLSLRDEYLQRAAPEVQKLRAELREAQDALLRVESYFGAAAMAEAQRHRGWLRRALALGADLGAQQQPQQRAIGGGV